MHIYLEKRNKNLGKHTAACVTFKSIYRFFRYFEIILLDRYRDFENYGLLIKKKVIKDVKFLKHGQSYN